MINAGEGDQKTSQPPVVSARARELQEMIELQVENGQLKAENERVKSELHREHEMHVRALADFDNYRRRADRDRDTAARESNLGLMRSLLDFVDDLELALDRVNSHPETIPDALQTIYRRLLEVLEGHGAVPFESLGHPFDPARHEVVEEIESDQEPGIILSEVRRGWRRGQEVLRRTQVTVAR